MTTQAFTALSTADAAAAFQALPSDKGATLLAARDRVEAANNASVESYGTAAGAAAFTFSASLAALEGIQRDAVGVEIVQAGCLASGHPAYLVTLS